MINIFICATSVIFCFLLVAVILRIIAIEKILKNNSNRKMMFEGNLLSRYRDVIQSHIEIKEVNHETK